METNNNQTVENENQDFAAQESEKGDIKKVIESLLFITDHPLTLERLAAVAETDQESAAAAVAEIKKEYSETARAVQVLEVAGGFQLATKPEYGRWVRKLYNEKMSVRLSNAALETLAIIAYKQPVTRSEVESIRGVDISAPLDKLLERGLVKTVGKKDTIGRPMMYGTSEEFLRVFGLNSTAELPSLEEFAARLVGPEEMTLPFDGAPEETTAAIVEEEEVIYTRETFTKEPEESAESTPAQELEESMDEEMEAALDSGALQKKMNDEMEGAEEFEYDKRASKETL